MKTAVPAHVLAYRHSPAQHPAPSTARRQIAGGGVGNYIAYIENGGDLVVSYASTVVWRSSW